MTDDRRLIEDYLPIEAISKEASREKSVRKGHISTLHLWWARRPLVACRAAVYGALVPAPQFVPGNGPDNKKQSLGRANAAKFVTELCKYPGNPTTIKKAQEHILEAHADRLTAELADLPAAPSDSAAQAGLSATPSDSAAQAEAAKSKQWPSWVEEFNWPKDKKVVTRADIEAGRAPRPRVLDMFAGGGAIPLEALRLGCEAYALDLNPVAHIIELCTLVYPQKYGKPDPTARGMTGPKNAKGETTWGGLAEEVRYWGEWVLERVRREIGDLYPPIPDMEFWSGTGCQPVNGKLPFFPGVKDGVARTRRHLPHWEKDGGCYFLTWRSAPGIELSPEARSIVLDNLKHWSGNRYDLWQAVVMPDHVHALLSPLPKEAVGQVASLSQNAGLAGRPTSPTYWTLSEIVHTAKSYTANEINRIMGRGGSLWQEERFDHLVRNPGSFEEKWCYIRHNPLRRGLAEKAEDYPWLYGDAGLAARPTLTPVAYLWTRTVRCKNPSCGATVPLVRQTWLCKKKGRYVAMKMVAPLGKKEVRFEVVESATEKGFGFDPAGFSKAGNATCPFCGTVADSDYVKAEGQAGRLSHQMMAIVCIRPGRQGKVYLSADDYPEFAPDDEAIRKRIDELCRRTGLTVPSEQLVEKLTDQLPNYGMKTMADLFTPRQMLCLLTFAAAVREAGGQASRLSNSRDGGHPETEHAKAVATYLGSLIDKMTTRSNTLCPWDSKKILTVQCFGRQALPMIWDFSESNPLADSSGAFSEAIDGVTKAVSTSQTIDLSAVVSRGSATALPWPDGSFDAVITDPPYYDNIQYAALSDFFYVWLKRTIGHLYPEHFSAEVSPKKSEAVASLWRHKSKVEARKAYEEMMAKAFTEANRVLKPGGQMTVVYAHKTTLGWSTLVDALRRAGFIVTEAWPLDTEGYRLCALNSAALASSIFLVARKRGGAETGSYEDEVRPDLDKIVRERVDSLWKMGITGADLVIACVGAGLRAFTRYERVEYANGEEVPAERFLAEVETVVLESILNRLSNAASPSSASSQAGSLTYVDPATRFYILWRYTYRWTELDAGETIVFANGTHVELEGPGSLSVGRAASPALIEKKKGKYRLRSYDERGSADGLGLPERQAGSLSYPPLIDVLHRTLWLMENRPRALAEFLRESGVNREQMRLVAQALAGPALKGGEMADVSPTSELAALSKLTANWRAVVEDAALTPLEREARRTGQKTIEFDKEQDT